MPLGVIIALAVVGALVLVLLLRRWLGYGAVGPTSPMRASAAEASERASDLFAEFFEWLRRGR
jgi:hypothetical protein